MSLENVCWSEIEGKNLNDDSVVSIHYDSLYGSTYVLWALQKLTSDGVLAMEERWKNAY